MLCHGLFPRAGGAVLKKSFSHLVLAFCTVASLGATQSAYAQEDRKFSSNSGEVVSEALQLINAGQHEAGLGKLGEALRLPELNAYERSTIHQMEGASYYALNQNRRAISSFQNAINAGGLLPDEIDKLKVNIAQLQIATGQYAAGAQALENYLNNGGEQKPAYVEMLMQACVQSGNYSCALPWAEKWFAAANPKERQHFDLMNVIYNKLGQQGQQADIVKEMINRWPEDKILWDAWASMLANGGREQEAFEVTKMLYLGGALNSEADLMKVVQYYSFYDMPYQAAQILEKEMNAGRISRDSDKVVQLSSLLRQAREYKRSIPVLESAAAISDQTKIYAPLGEALYKEGQCQKAETAFQEAINRGYDAGRAWMLIATCRYEDTQKHERINCDMSDAQKAQAPISIARANAVQAFEQVPSSSSESQNAKKWVSFLKAEEDAIKRRCEFESSVIEGTCFQKIKQAYDLIIFTGGFELSDPNCAIYKEEYDAKFRVKIVEE